MSFLKDVSERLVDPIVNNPKTAIAVPTATAAIGKLSDIAAIQSWLTIISMVMGLFISAVILVHWLSKTGTAIIEYKVAKRKLEELIKNDAN